MGCIAELSNRQLDQFGERCPDLEQRLFRPKGDHIQARFQTAPLVANRPRYVHLTQSQSGLRRWYGRQLQNRDPTYQTPLWPPFLWWGPAPSACVLGILTASSHRRSYLSRAMAHSQALGAPLGCPCRPFQPLNRSTQQLPYLELRSQRRFASVLNTPPSTAFR